MPRIATRNGKPAHVDAAPRLRASDLDPRELPEWLQREADTTPAPWGRAILAVASIAAITLLIAKTWA